MSAETISPTGKHAYCERCYELGQMAEFAARQLGVSRYNVVDGNHSGHYSHSVRIV